MAALAVVAGGCSSAKHATRLRIEVAAGSGVRAYSLRCNPAGGTAPQPAQLCSYLRTNPNLLVGGPRLDHSCPAQPGGGKIFRVSGRYRGHPTDATFASTACGFVPGQGAGWSDWTWLMAGAGPGIREQRLSTRPADRAERQRLLRREQELRRDLGRLGRERSRALADGTLQLVAGRAPDRLTQRILREQVELEGLPNGPFPGDARVYSTTRRRTGSVGGTRGLPGGRNEPVYVVVVRYAYRDYTGRRRLEPTALAGVVEAGTLETTDVAWGAPWNPAGLGPPLDLAL